MTNELSALVEAAGEAVDRLAITPAESLHAAISRRVFRAVGPASTPTRLIHDGITKVVYGTIRRTVTTAFGAAAATTRAAAGGADVRPLSRSRGGRIAVGAINALIGDQLDERGSDLAISMAIRQAAEDVPCERSALEHAFPTATARVAVFLHGLGETEERWLRGSDRHVGAEALPFSVQLQRDLGITPVDIRYNSGLRVSQNGLKLAELLNSLLEAWPVTIDELDFVGHSMGGLIARSACHAGTIARHDWPSRVRHLITLGAPHTGAPLEKAVHAVSWALRKVPEARPMAEILDARSAGIRDLRFGYLVEDDWRGEDPRKLLDDRRSQVPLPRDCTHTFIAATVTQDPAHPIGWALGDLLVRTDSGIGRHRERSIPVPPGSSIHIGRLTHFDLLDHPLVYERVRNVLSGAAAAQ
jgi:pimeloyl-ACP methyl ester carboxylesterase